jgi:DNA polymerase III subunit gamma/tau
MADPTPPADTDAKTGDAKPYVVLARKYRPETFTDLIGQEAMVKTLTNAFASDRIAQGYMLTGVRGVGKTTTARILARALNYAKPGLPDKPSIVMDAYGQHCADIIASRHPDVVEMDAASNTGIENIREIIESARYKPIIARTKVFIIDEVHMLSKGAFNALLKTLEEPPAHVKFIFATTEIRKVPVTVLSRCQRFDLRRVDVPVLVKHFERIVAAEGATAETEALLLIARAAEGSVRDGLSILDQGIAMGSGAVTAPSVRAMLGLADRGRVFDLLGALLGGDAAAALAGLASLHHDGAEPVQVLADLADAVHVTTRVKTAGRDAAGDALSAEEKRRAHALAESLSLPILSRAWQMLLKGIDEAGKAPNPLSAADMVLIRIAYTSDLPTPDDLIRTLGGGVVARAGGGVSAPGRDGGPPPRGPLNAAPLPPPAARATPGSQAGSQAPLSDDVDDSAVVPPWEDLPPEADGSYVDEDTAPPPPRFNLNPRNFHELVELVGQKRDAKLRIHLEEHVSLLKFELGAEICQVEIRTLEGAPQNLAGDLGDKLTKWTGRRWVIVLGRGQGERPLGMVAREEAAKRLAEVKAHPAVAAVLRIFPEVEVKSVKPLPGIVGMKKRDGGAAG